jgi:hypothetical protein
MLSILQLHHALCCSKHLVWQDIFMHIIRAKGTYFLTLVSANLVLDAASSHKLALNFELYDPNAMSLCKY